MRVKLLTTISFFTYQLGISQTEKLINGKVFNQDHTLKGVEVINKTAKTSTRTNELGEFSILVSPKDSLLFFHKDYFFSRLKITPEHIQTNNLVVNMILKAEELKEVVITQIKFDKVKYDADAVSQINVGRQANDLKYHTGVNDGTIRNGLSLAIPIGSGKPKEKFQVDERFKKLVAASCPPDFFTKTLKLNPEEKELFLEFCDADPRSKSLLEHENILSTMDFLLNKSIIYKKQNSELKN